MKKIRLLILEDKFLVAENLIDMSLQLGFEVVATCDSAEEAIEQARRSKPDVALLDIMVKGRSNGIHAGNVIGSELGIPCIFLTDLQSIEVYDLAKPTRPHAFLNKPVTILDLKRNVELAAVQHSTTTEETSKVEDKNLVYGPEDVVFLKNKEGKTRVHMDEIYFLKASGGYCDIFLKDGKYTQAKPLSAILEELEELSSRPRFLRIHKSSAVNVDYVEEIKGNMVRVKNEWLDVSERNRETVKNLFRGI